MKAYLIKNVEYDGDTYIKIVDEATFNYILYGGTMPSSQVAAKHQQFAKWKSSIGLSASDLADEIADLADDRSSRQDADQERAMQVTSTDFNGKTFDQGYKDTKDILKFLTDNNLVLTDEFQGLSW